ncbi:MAG: hypothetical protein KJ600_00570 [Nanoarchaeota archaeon]|nr:hypothetical protein [Nanoarchaeota archaeon]MBU1103036.1 hypothetical protein [Nanoarchaeota archaeon]
MLKKYAATVESLGFTPQCLLEPSSTVVYRATERSSEKDVVVKLPSSISDPSVITRENEFLEAMGPTEGLVPKHAYFPRGLFEEHPVLVRPYVAGKTWKKEERWKLDETHRPRLERVVNKAHKLDLGDIDIRIQNIILRNDGVADFFDLMVVGGLLTNVVGKKEYDWRCFNKLFQD